MCVSEQLVKGRNRCAAAGIEPAISSRKSNALTTTPPSHTPSHHHHHHHRLWDLAAVRLGYTMIHIHTRTMKYIQYIITVIQPKMFVLSYMLIRWYT